MDSRDWLLSLLMGGIHFAYHVLIRLIPSLIPVLAIALGYPLWKLGLLVSISLVGSSIGLLPMGVLSDRYDRQAILSGSLAVAGAGYVLFAVAPTVGTPIPRIELAGHVFNGPFVLMCGAMLVAGLGTSAHVPVGIPFLTRNASEGNQGTVLGFWGAGSKFGDAAAPALVGLLILGLGWSQVLLLFGLFGVTTALLLYFVIGASEFDTRPGAASTESDTPESDADCIWTDRRRYLYPMAALLGYFAAYSVVVQGTVAFVPAFITDVYGYSATVWGLSFGPESFADFVLAFLLVAAGISRVLGGALVDRYEHRIVLFGTLLVAATALFAFSVLTLRPLALVLVASLFGAAIWGNSPARDSIISDITPADREGRTFSYLFTASRVFGALSPALIGLMADTVGIRLGFIYLSVTTLVAALFVALLFSDRVYDGMRASDGSATLDD